MKELYIASKNKHKIEEMKERLSSLGLEIKSLLDLDQEFEIIEDKDTFEGNALKKAKTLYAYLQKPVLADDSGLMVDALKGAPGVYSARYSGQEATDEENNALLLKNMEGVLDRTARFVTVMVVLGLEEEAIVTQGTLEGEIALSPKEGHGFGYDPIFIVKEDGRYLSEYLMEEKNQISHRGKALNKLIKHFK